jgi:hypothetical protein
LLKDTQTLAANTVSTPEIGFLSFNSGASTTNQANQGGSWNPLQSSLYPQSGTLGQYPPLTQPFPPLSVPNALLSSPQSKLSGALPQPKVQQQPDFNLISGLWSKEPSPASNITPFNTNTLNNTHQSNLLNVSSTWT